MSLKTMWLHTASWQTCLWDWPGTEQFHHLHMNLVRLDLRLWLASRRNLCQTVGRHRTRAGNFDCYWQQKLAGGWIHRTSWMHAGGNQARAAKQPENTMKPGKRAFFVAVFLRCLLPTKLNLMWADKEEKFIGSSSLIWEQGTEGWVDLELRVLNC